MKINVIVAKCLNGGIGFQNNIPWYHKKDLQLFKELTINRGKTSLIFRKKMSQIAFSETAYYDAVISNYFNTISKTYFPQKIISFGNLIEKLRYGENPHQVSAIYSKNLENKLNQIHGKALSYNNYNDILSALIVSKSFPKNKGTVIVKHGNPCGVSVLKNNIESYKSALKCDPISAFGGIVSLNFKVTKSVAIELEKQREKPNFQVAYLATNKKGEIGAYSIHKGFSYTLYKNNKCENINSKSLY